MALSADAMRDTRARNNVQKARAAIKTSSTVYVGSLLAFTTLGRVQAAAAAASLRPAGVCTAIVNESGASITAGTGNAGGTIYAEYEWGHEVLVAVKTAARTLINLGKNVFISDDDAVTDTTGAGTAAVRVKIGSITEFDNTSTKATAWMAVRVYGDADAT